MTTLLLASSSKYRKAQLAALGLDVKTMAPDIDETPAKGESAEKLAMRLAKTKAQKAGNANPDYLTLGADQVAMVTTDEGVTLLGKPGSIDKACEQLMLCQGHTVSFYTALCIYHGTTQRCITQYEITNVYFRALTPAQISQYVSAERPLDCAGSFKCEGLGALLFDRIEGRDPNSLIGLPVMLLRDLLTHFDVDLLEQATAAYSKKRASLT
ncbi:Maf family protein [Salinimonas chungwhensis]|uniref:Maf family protein n=1 Tax=Salinimonas chungwhensis TaxID=265425 RepID=UPI0003744710|nr:nucleoside triphosphate pyrophosphatase [Salinimonas chungwhensis]